jgi:site-specific recombinase XerD
MKQTKSPLQKALEARVRLLDTTLQPATMNHYRHTMRLFLRYLSEQYPEVSSPSQLRRDPHLLGWLEYLWKYRTSTGQPLNVNTRGQHVLRLRTLLELLADFPHPPAAGLLRGQDVPPRQHRLPRPLTPQDDARLQQHWAGATDLCDCALLLQRLSGMRIGECVDLAPDCLRHLGDNRWSLHVPLGKPRSERLVPLDDRARVVIERLAFLRTLPPGADPSFLLPRPKGRTALLSAFRHALHEAASQVGIKEHIVPHQLRHTYATTMLRYGVSLPALMKLLGHSNANMTLLYVEVTQQDLQREYQAARLHPRHQMPLLPVLQQNADDISVDFIDAAVVANALTSALRLLDLHRQLLPSSSTNKQLLLLSRRITRIRTLFEKLSQRPPEEK